MDKIDTADNGTSIHLRIDRELAVGLEDWRRNQREIPSRPAAVRRLIARALANIAAS